MFALSREKKILLGLEFFFLVGMWTSKTVWPLWFHESGNLKFYGISYAAMAMTGILSLFIGPLIQKQGTRRAILAGIPLYAAGISLRWFNQNLGAAVLSGILGGLGASTVLLAIRTLARGVQEKGADHEFIATRKMLGNVGMGAGGLIAALLLTYGGYAAAVFAGLAPLTFAWFLQRSSSKNASLLTPPENPSVPVKWHSMREILAHPSLLNLILLSIVGGIFTSLIAPYLPILFAERGLSNAKISLLGTVGTIAAFLAQAIGVRVTRKLGERYAFMSGEFLFLGGVALLLAIHSLYWIPFLVAIRVVGRSISSLAEEIWEVGAVPSAYAASYYGAAQAAFLVGDSLGGALGGFVVANFTAATSIRIGLVLTVLHGTGWILMFEKRRRDLFREAGLQIS